MVSRSGHCRSETGVSAQLGSAKGPLSGLQMAAISVSSRGRERSATPSASRKDADPMAGVGDLHLHPT